MYSYQDNEGNKYAVCQFGGEGKYRAVRIVEEPFSVIPLHTPVRSELEYANLDMDWFAVFHGLKKVFCDSVSFPGKTTQMETCPLCSHYPLDMKAGEFEGNYYVTPWDCPSCGTNGRQMDKVDFDGHVMDLSGFTIPSKLITTE